MPPLQNVAEPETPFVDDAPAPAAPSPRPAFHRHRAWLLAALRLRFGRDAAEDLAQEAFLRASQHAPAAPLRSPRAWLLTVALNAARDQARRRAVRPPLTEAEGAYELKDAPEPADQDQALLLKQVILALPPRLRETFLLSRFGGMTYEEIARRLQISRKTVEWRMTKALAICAALLKD